MTSRCSARSLFPLLAVAILLTTAPLLAQNNADPKPSPDAAPDAVVDADGKPIENPFPARGPAPDFDGGTGWLNTSGEISIKDLRGKVVLVDFWTYCCINCMHVLPDLKYLEAKYPNELVVIGCHSAKFDNEKDSDAIRQAVVRYEIAHPVINDSQMRVWDKFGASSWPSLAVIDPEGNYVGSTSGEGKRELLDHVVGSLVKYHRAKGTLDETPFNFELERSRIVGGALKYPGKLLADESGNRLFISDSNHNRVVIATLDGRLLDVVGNGSMGRQDGAYAAASFDHPQGMELVGETLYVADTENHSIRTVDLTAKTVATLAGTGMQARFRESGGPLKATALNSPWDLNVVGDTLFVAMAGPHQIWSHKLGGNDIGVFSGSGREDILDGPHDEAALAQPSGIDSDGRFLFVADSEGSAIRRIAIDPKGDVATIVGSHDLARGRSLFTFGDVDAVGNDARLQHPLGVALSGSGELFIADAYNHKIKHVDLKTLETTTFVGTGKFGDGLEPLQLHEPAGMAVGAGSLFIADTNNHRVVKVDLKSKAASVFEIAGLTAPVPATESAAVAALTPKEQLLPAESQTVSGDAFKLAVELQFPEGYKLNDLAPVRAKLVPRGEQSLIPAAALAKSVKGELAGSVATFDIPLAGSNGEAEFELSVSYSYCRGGVGGLCKLHTARWLLPLKAAADGGTTISLKTDLPK